MQSETQAAVKKTKRKILEKGQKTRRVLVQKAIEVFSERGFHHAKVDDVVKAAGYAKGTVYQYFKSKDELLSEIIGNFERLSQSRLQDFQKKSDQVLLKPVSSKEYLFFLRELFTAVEDLFYQQKDTLKIFLQLRLDPSNYQKEVQKIFQSWLRFFDGSFQNAKNRGCLQSAIPSNHLAQFAWGLLLENAYQLIVLENRDPRETMESILKFIELGLQPK